MVTKYRHIAGGIFSALLLLIFMVIWVQLAETATSSKTNNTVGQADGSFITRTVTFGAADFSAGAQIESMTLAVDFEKINGNSCATGHQGGNAYNGEIYMLLQSPTGTEIPLINDSNDNAIPSGPTTYNNISYANRVMVTFDDQAGTKVGGLPATGTFRPEGSLASIVGEDPAGVWMLTFGDGVASDALCFNSFTLTVNASQPPVVDDQTFNVDETAAIGSPVDTIVATDNDPGEKLNFALLSSVPTADFNLNSLTGQLTVKNTLDYEVTSVYTLTVRVTDSSGLSDTATITINVVNNNEAPLAVADTNSTDEDTAINASAPGVLANDSDPDGPTPTVDTADNTSAQGAAVTVNANGSYSYDPTGAANLQALQVGSSVDDTFNYTVTDGDLTDSAVVTITVAGVNDVPLPVNDTASTSEGTPVDIFVLNNDSDVDTGDTISVISVGTPATGNAVHDGTKVTFTPADATSPVVFTYTVQDSQAATATALITVTVSNAAPELQNVSAAAISENGTATLTGTIADMSSSDSYTLTVNWGDGSMPEAFTYSGTGPINETHQYLDDDADDSYTINLTLEDSVGGQDTANTNITVTNLAPVLSNVSATPGTITEGDMVTIDGDIADVGTLDTFSVQITWGDGSNNTYTYPAGTTSFQETHVYADDNPTNTASDVNSITVTLSDDDNGSDNDSSQIVTVNNSAPSLSGLSLTAGSIDEGGTATLSGTINDLGTADSYVLTVDWGDGVEIYNYNTTGAFNANHVYTDDSAGGSFTVTASLADDDTGTDNAGTVGNITVNNVAPQPTNLSATATNEGSMTTFTAVMGDPGAADTFTVTIDWGDGLTDTFSYPAGSTAINETHTYADDNPTATPSDSYTIVLTIEDDEGASGNDTTSVTVSNVAPTVNAGPDMVVSKANPVAIFAGSFTDPGTDDTHTITWEFGDGSMTTGTLVPTHTYPAVEATYIITLTVTDDDTGSDVDMLMIEIGNTPPIVVDDADDTDEDTVLTVTAPGLLGNDSDTEGDDLTVTAFDTISAGGAAVNVAADGSFIYDPTGATFLQGLAVGDVFIDTFTYTVEDTEGAASTGLVLIDVTGVNDNPEAVADNSSTNKGASTTILVLLNDVDIDGDTLAVTAVGTPANGTATTDGNSVTYTPNATFTGNDSFTYTISDGHGGSSTGMVDVVVSGTIAVYLPLTTNRYVVAPDLVVTAVSGRSNLIEVTIANQGTKATETAFWVDFYIDPTSAPIHPNQFWQDLSTQGLVWLVDVPLAPGESLKLSYSTAANAPNIHFAPQFSFYSGTLATGTPLYAQVDSAHINTTFGGILETHEILGTAYNNVSALATAQ